MAISIVSDADSSASLSPAVSKESRWYCDRYKGSASALIQAGYISAEHLTPQPGRAPGRTAFMPDGRPCPLRAKPWREPGFKAVQQLEDGEYRVEITVSRDVQKWRRSQERSVQQDEEQQRIDKELAARGQELRSWKLEQSITSNCELWVGTKAQLQAAGLGKGMKFPGELGAPAELNCACPLGFSFSLRPHYDSVKAAAGIYFARSDFVGGDDKPVEYVEHAPGVKREVWTTGGWRNLEKFIGSAEALVAAGLVPDLTYFPGQPGANRLQASYTCDWRAATNSSASRVSKITILKRGGGLFCLDLPVGPEEAARREELRREKSEEHNAKCADLAEERRRLRQATGPQMSAEAFRRNRLAMVETGIDIVRSALLRTGINNASGLRLDIPEGSAALDRLNEAFVEIQEVIASADVVRDKQSAEKIKSLVKLAAARNDMGLQAVLRSASHLRLVRGASDDL